MTTSQVEGRPLRRIYLQTPPQPAPAAGLAKLRRYLMGSGLAPIYWALGHFYRTPGLAFHGRCAWLGLRIMARRRTQYALGWAYQLMFLPIDSTRYFEFDFAWRSLGPAPLCRYLDVSSPRVFPVLMADQRRDLAAELINPDQRDLSGTLALVRAAGLTQRCQLHDCLIEAAPFQPGEFDAITSLSVVEHIQDDTAAIRKMWDLLRPGGQLVITVPCAREAIEQYIDHNVYNLPAADGGDYVFFQRFYDLRLLNDRIFCVTGLPRQQAIFGEKAAGRHQTAMIQKMATYTTTFPFWEEPVVMGREFARFPSISALPGEGVVAMEFVKP